MSHTCFFIVILNTVNLVPVPTLSVRQYRKWRHASLSDVPLVCAQYILYANGQEEPDAWVMRGIAIAAYGIACLSMPISRHTSYDLD